jgi:beta-mannosidase
MTMAHAAAAPDRHLDDGWTLSQPERGIETEVAVPFDVHSALLAAGIIDDPYWRARELDLDWVHQTDWTLRRDVTLGPEATGGHWTLSLDGLDCVATIRVNGRDVGKVASQFLRHDIDVTGALAEGDNAIEITLHSNSAAARAAARAFPFELPYSEGNCRIPHINHLRKTQCHAGWDWNIALMPLGLYGGARLTRSDLARLDEIKVVQRHRPGHATLEVTAHAEGFGVGEVPLIMRFGGLERRADVAILPGRNRATLRFEIDSPELWWPAGEGAQVLHDLEVTLAGRTIARRVGLRQIELLTAPDAIGARFAIAVNGREIFMRGANWIPADALPARCTPATVKALLRSATEAHMNMLRIWGGGQYEPDWFYDLCDEAGILLWHDFMFACAHYPAADPAWLALVRTEARQQIRRLSSHASMALWCGDNELVGALSWWPVTRANRDRYLANYVILNHALEEAVAAEAVDVPFWPSSPSSGRLNYGDAWHDDRSGDMHFWDVWHSAREFEHYRSVRPRFCSEFGFQSFPSLPVIERFTEPGDRNVSSPVMDIHQRNIGGNARIVETISRYFRFPDGFADMVFLSQVGQGLAMRTAIEFWRSTKPRCMGTLYWQLNDTWPVASWASLEHGGGWKVCHYLARRFYAPVLVTAQPDPETGETVILAVADRPEGARIEVGITAHCLDGSRSGLGDYDVSVPTDAAVEVARLVESDIPDDAFLRLTWPGGASDHFPRRYKAYDLPRARVTAAWTHGPDGPELELAADAPAFFVTVDPGGTTVWSDNALTLLPGEPRRIRPLFDGGTGAPASPDLDSIPPIQHLAGAGHRGREAR